jgi:hypothetical protein
VIGSRTCWTGQRERAGTSQALLATLLGAALGLQLGCSDDPQPDPPDTSGGAGGAGSCPNDLPSSSACGNDLPSYQADAAPIIERRCNGCHFPGNPQSGDVFAEYADVYSRRQTVLTRVYTCVMPPAAAAELTAGERATLLEWLVCGAPDN